MSNHRRKGSRRFGGGALCVALAAAAWSVGCASEDSGHEGAFPRGADWGGQTGSLVPPTSGPSCGPVTGKDRILTLAGVAPSLLINADAAVELGDAGTTQDHWYITNEDGEVIDLLDPASEGAAVLRPEEELAPGNYELNYRCGGVDQTVELVIEEPKPAPRLVENAALWYPPSEYTCESIEYSVSVTLTLDPDAPALVDSAELSVEGDGFSMVVAPFASIGPSATTFEFAVPICRSAAETNCVPQTGTSLAVVTSWLDETLPQHRVVLDVDANCDDEPRLERSAEPSMTPDEGACAVSRDRAGGGGLLWGASILVAVACLARHWRRRGSHEACKRQSLSRKV